MNQDQQTYKRAAGAALIGLFTQLLLAVGMAILDLYADSSALSATTWYFFGGLPIWVMLWVVFNSNRLERAEALEAEQLARADARSAALFEEAGEQLQVARKRVENLYRWGLPFTGLLLSLYLLGWGLALGYRNWQLLQDGALSKTVLSLDASAGLLSLLLAAVAFIGFLVARYVAGMTMLKQWELLRGGASYLMGNTAMSVLLLVSAIAAYFGNIQVLTAAAIVVPAVMAVLGVEMLIGFVLGIYRPRRPGEIMRPPFDSRVLGWITRPESLGKIISETLNYQFGFEISKSWFYRLLARAVTPLIVIGLVVLLGLSSLVVVAPQQQAVITSFGRLVRVVPSGAHFKLPWPLGRAEKYDVSRVHQITVGSLAGERKIDAAILWTNEHAQGDEEYLLVAPTPLGEDMDIPLISGELVGGEVVIDYRISNLEAYVTGYEKPEDVLQNLAERRVSAYFVTRDIDTLLSMNRLEAGRTLRQQLQEDIDGRNLGLEVVFVGLVGIHPPQKSDVAAAFHEQIGALQEKQSMLQDAEKEAITTLVEVAGSREMATKISKAIGTLEQLQRELDAMQRGGAESSELTAKADAVAEQGTRIEELLDEAGGKAIQSIYDARAYRWTQAISERARADRFAAQLAAYQNSPRYYTMRRYFETLAEGMKNQRKIIVTAEQTEPTTVRLNLEDAKTGLESILNAD